MSCNSRLSVTDLIIDSETDEEESAGMHGDDLFFVLGHHLCEHIYSAFQAAAEVDHWRPPRGSDLGTVDVLNEMELKMYYSVRNFEIFVQMRFPLGSLKPSDFW